MTAPTFDLLADGTLSLGELADRTRPDEPFAPGADFWDDPHIAGGLLDAHLDPDRDAASRSHDRIDAEVDWLVSALSLEAGDAVLDLGCGPGLYCERLHDRGLEVTGVDLSRAALDRAEVRAEGAGREIRYRRGDYRDLEYEREFDAAVLVYFDFGTYGDDDRAEILRGVRRALGSGGRFAFDVYTGRHRTAADAGRDWNLQAGSGFWRPVPHLVLAETVPYADGAVYLDQHLVVDERGDASAYRFWERHYEPAELRTLLSEHGYAVDGVWEDLRGTDYADGSESIGVVARRAG